MLFSIINVKYLDKGFDTRNYRVNFNKVRDTLVFVPDFNIDDGNWIHKGKTSKGDPLHEIWQKRQK